LVFLVQYSEVLSQEKNIHPQDILLKFLDLQENNNNEEPASPTSKVSYEALFFSHQLSMKTGSKWDISV